MALARQVGTVPATRYPIHWPMSHDGWVSTPTSPTSPTAQEGHSLAADPRQVPVPPAAEEVTPGGPPTSSPRRMGTAKSMVISMVVVLGFVLVWLAMVPRPSYINQPPVDVLSVARQAKVQSGLALTSPQGLPTGWKASDARYQRSSNNVMTWHVQYSTPGGQYAAVDQAARVTPAWVHSHVLFSTRVGTRQIEGRTWVTYRRAANNLYAMVRPASSSGGITIVASGTAPYPVLQELVEHLRPVRLVSSAGVGSGS